MNNPDKKSITAILRKIIPAVIFLIFYLSSNENVKAQTQENFINPALAKGNNLHTNKTLTADSLIKSVISEINTDSIKYNIQSLQNFGTRYCLGSDITRVAEWIKNRFIGFGIDDTRIDSFLYGGIWQKNILAVIKGKKRPDEFYVLGAHLDSYSNSAITFAPGADDNASGTSAVIETARAFMAKNYQPDVTIIFAAFGAEETGLWGSKDLASKLKKEHVNVGLMVNFDMISMSSRSVSDAMVNINYYGGSEYLLDESLEITKKYTRLTPFRGDRNSSGSDSYSFWAAGYPAVYFEEYEFSPFYHSTNDVISNYNMEYCAEVTKAAASLIINNQSIPPSPKNFVLKDAGSGNSLILKWDVENTWEELGYKVYAGTSSGNYSEIYRTTNNYLEITGLKEGTSYYVGVSAISKEGIESKIIERNAIPYYIPLAPLVSDSSLWHKIKLFWNSNQENDLLGYNLYRAESRDGKYVMLNSMILKDTTYIDESPLTGSYNYYYIKAVDSLLNESVSSNIVKTRDVSLDRGILLVDETFDGDGSAMNPSDAETDSFYYNLLEEYSPHKYDVRSEGAVRLADIGAYSTVIIYSDNVAGQPLGFSYLSELKRYLDFGGKLIYLGYRPSKVFSGSNSQKINFSAGDFIYSYMKIGHAEMQFGSISNGAKSLNNSYSNIFVDSVKIPSSQNYNLLNIESITATAGADEVYKYDTAYDSTSIQGKMKNMTVGVEYLGADFKTFTLSYPLYFLRNEHAESLIKTILKRMNTISLIEDHNSVPVHTMSYKLIQNYPNPFNPETVISYEIPFENDVRLTVYDILGREVSTLINQHQKAGKYQVRFNAGGLSGGVYIYTIKSGEYSQSHKMMLLK